MSRSPWLGWIRELRGERVGRRVLPDGEGDELDQLCRAVRYHLDADEPFGAGLEDELQIAAILAAGHAVGGAAHVVGGYVTAHAARLGFAVAEPHAGDLGRGEEDLGNDGEVAFQ